MGGVMKIVYSLLLLVGVSITASCQTDYFKQNVAVNPPFKLEITANLDKEHSYLWDFVNSAETTVKAGSIIVVAIRKTNISEQEINKSTHVGIRYGFAYEVRDSGGNLVSLRHPNEIKMVGDGRGGHIIGTKDNILQPGESKIDLGHVSDVYDMSKPGRYTIQVCEHIFDDANSDVVKSNIITITVVAPEPETVAPQ
jgi:hypothetical protein